VTFYHDNSKLHNKVQISQTKDIQVQWRPPSGDCLCFNIDDAFQNNNSAGCGVLFRDSYGNQNKKIDPLYFIQR
jgi:hypothetical protein